jgi:hypothetical protein
MPALSQFRFFTKFALAVALVAIAAGSACSRPAEFQSNDNASDGRKVPFHQESSSSNSAAPQAEPAPVSAPAPKLFPFNKDHARIIPAGTLFTVRLEQSLSGAKSITPTDFTATLADPIVIDAVTAIEKGASLNGHIEAADTSANPGSGFVRLTLNSIEIDGHSLPLQTSSLFARGKVRGPTTSSVAQKDPFMPFSSQSAGIVDLKKGRRLTFRLTEELELRTP